MRTRLGGFAAAVDHGPRRLVVRAPRHGAEPDNDDFVWQAALHKAKKPVWPELSNLLGRIKREGDRVFGGIEFGHVWLELLDRGTALPWTSESGPYIERYTRLHLALRTNPQAMMFSGCETMHLLPGALTAVAVRVPNCAINLGEQGRLHLVVDVRKKDTTE